MKNTDKNMKVVISGYGKMGHMVESVLKNKGIELAVASENVCEIDKSLASGCVCIDFTTPEAFRANYKFLAANFKAVVVGTTGWNDIKEDVIGEFERKGTPMIYASNFSIGVNAFFAGVERVCEVLKGYGYNPSVTEIHHTHKLDAPSGTAKSVGGIITDVMGVEPKIESIREGEVPGTHIVELRSECDRLTFTHEAFSRQGFAEGAVAAALMTESLSGVHEFRNLVLDK